MTRWPAYGNCPFKPHQMLDQYEITNKLDMGGFGEVYKAVSFALGDFVVIKK